MGNNKKRIIAFAAVLSMLSGLIPAASAENSSIAANTAALTENAENADNAEVTKY